MEDKSESRPVFREDREVFLALLRADLLDELLKESLEDGRRDVEGNRVSLIACCCNVRSLTSFCASFLILRTSAAAFA